MCCQQDFGQDIVWLTINPIDRITTADYVRSVRARATRRMTEPFRVPVLAGRAESHIGVKVDRMASRIAHRMVIFQWQDGKKVIVRPAELAPDKPRFPTPPWNQRP